MSDNTLERAIGFLQQTHDATVNGPKCTFCRWEKNKFHLGQHNPDCTFLKLRDFLKEYYDAHEAADEV